MFIPTGLSWVKRRSLATFFGRFGTVCASRTIKHAKASIRSVSVAIMPPQYQVVNRNPIYDKMVAEQLVRENTKFLQDLALWNAKKEFGVYSSPLALFDIFKSNCRRH